MTTAFLQTNVGKLLAYAGLLTAGVIGQAQAQMNVTIKPAHASANTTCFDKQGYDAKYRAVADSTVMLLAIGDGNKVLGEGSGVIVANSAASVTAGNRILTDAHVTGIREKADQPPREPVKTLMVFTSGGALLGEAKPMVLATHDVSRNSVGDVAVLEMTKFSDNGGAASYAAIPGIKLARLQSPSGFQHIETTGGVGVAPGASGGPWVNQAGELIGLAGSISADHIAVAKVDRPVLFDIAKREVTGDPVTTQTIYTSGDKLAFINAISYKQILDALGEAGKGVYLGITPEQKAMGFGMPSGFCQVYQADTHPLDTADPNEFVAPENIAKQPLFDDWKDPVKSLAYVQGLLQQAKKDHHSHQVDEAISSMADMKTFTDVGETTVYNDLDAVAQMARNPQLKLQLAEASSVAQNLQLANGLQKHYVGLQPSRPATLSLGGS